MFFRFARFVVAIAITLFVELTPVVAQAPSAVLPLPDAERRTSYSITSSTCACSGGFALCGDSTDFQNWLEVSINGEQVQYNDPVFGWTVTSPSDSLSNLARPITEAVPNFNNVQTGTVQIVGARRPRRVSQFSGNTGPVSRPAISIRPSPISSQRCARFGTKSTTSPAA